MSNTKKGMLGNSIERTQGNIEPKSFYDDTEKNNDTELTKKENIKTEKTIIKSNDRKNQQSQIKISKSLKNEILAIKSLTKTDYEYEVLQLLIDNYKNGLSSEEIKKLRLINDLNLM